MQPSINLQHPSPRPSQGQDPIDLPSTPLDSNCVSSGKTDHRRQAVPSHPRWQKNLLRQHAVAHQQRLTSSPVSQPPPTNPPSPSTNRSRLVLLPLNTHADTQHSPVDPSAVEPATAATYFITSARRPRSIPRKSPPIPPIRHPANPPTPPTPRQGRGKISSLPANKDSPPPRPRTHSTQLLFCQTCNFFFLPTPLPSRPDRLK